MTFNRGRGIKNGGDNIRIANLTIQYAHVNQGGSAPSYMCEFRSCDHLDLVNVNFHGPGSIDAQNPVHCCFLSGNYIQVQDCEFAYANRAYGLECDGVGIFSFTNTAFHTNGWDGLKLRGSYGALNYCTFYENGQSQLLSSGNGNGVDIPGGSFITFNGCTAWDNYSTAFQVKSTQYNEHPLSDITFSNCDVYSGKVCSYMPGGSAFAVVDATAQVGFDPAARYQPYWPHWIERITFDNCGAGGQGINAGFFIGPSKNGLITGCSVIGCDGPGISMQPWVNIYDRGPKDWSIRDTDLVGNGRRQLYQGAQQAMIVTGTGHSIEDINCVSAVPGGQATQGSVKFTKEGWRQKTQSPSWQWELVPDIGQFGGIEISNLQHDGTPTYEYVHGATPDGVVIE